MIIIKAIGMDLLATLIIVGTLNALYFLPSIIARKKTNDFKVMLVNLFFGWTFIGWVIALIMATNSSDKVDLVKVLEIQRDEILKLRKSLTKIEQPVIENVGT